MRAVFGHWSSVPAIKRLFYDIKQQIPSPPKWITGIGIVGLPPPKKEA